MVGTTAEGMGCHHILGNGLGNIPQGPRLPMPNFNICEEGNEDSSDIDHNGGVIPTFDFVWA